MAGRRRQILQLDSRIGRSDSGGKSVKSKLESHPANPLLGMMSSYHSDDEEDLQVDSEEKAVKEIESVHQTTAKTTSSKQSQLDEQVADFLRTLAASEEPDPSPNEAENNTDEVLPSSDGTQNEAQEVEKIEEIAPQPEVSSAAYVWEACVDTNSGYTYYWNKQTNEVTWTLPDGVVLASNAEQADEQKTTLEEAARSPLAPDKEVEAPQALDDDLVEYGPLPLSSEVLVDGEEDEAGDDSECDTNVPEHTADMPVDEAVDSRSFENADSAEPQTFVEVMVGGALVSYHASPESDEDSDIDDMLDRALNTEDSTLVMCDERKGAKRQAGEVEEDETTSCKKLKESRSELEEGEDDEEVPQTDEGRNEHSAEEKEEEQVEVECSALAETKTEQTELNSKVALSCRELNRRLTLLGATTSGLHPLILELVKLEARSTDWQNGALTAEYLMQRLQESTQLLADYEALVPPPGWTYVWDSDFERYYFYNSATDKASWDYPTANPSTDQQKDSPALSTASSAASRDVSVSPPTTPPPGVDSAASPPPVKEEWQGPPPPPPPLEEGEIPPSPPTPPVVEGPEFKDEDEECEADESYQLESGPLLYYGPSAPPSGVLPAEQEDSTPSGSRNASPAPEDGEPKKKKKKVVKVKMHGRKGKAVSSLLQKWAGLREEKS